MEVKRLELRCGESAPMPGSTKRRIYGPRVLTKYVDVNSTHTDIGPGTPDLCCSDRKCENPLCVTARKKKS